MTGEYSDDTDFLAALVAMLAASSGVVKDEFDGSVSVMYYTPEPKRFSRRFGREFAHHFDNIPRVTDGAHWEGYTQQEGRDAITYMKDYYIGRREDVRLAGEAAANADAV